MWRRRRVRQVVGAAGSIVDRSGGTIAFDVPLESLLDYVLPTYDAEKLPALRARPARGEARLPADRPDRPA